MWRQFLAVICIEFLMMQGATSQTSGSSIAEITEMLGKDQPYHVVSQQLFDRLGWELPDRGQTVKKLADLAPGGALDPRTLTRLPVEDTGYSSRWHELRYKAYGVDWDVTGLYLTPRQAVEGMPTVVLIHGGSSNWYEFFLDPLNNPGLGQYLAQKVPVLIVTIPGNFIHGGWKESALERRIPAYVLDRDISNEEARVRHAAYTFQMVTDGVRRLIESVTTGPVVVIGHSTAGEIPYMLHNSSLKERMNGWFLGWGSGGTSSQQAMQRRWGNEQTVDDYPPVGELRPRTTDGYEGDYLGPLNPVWEEGVSRELIAKRWMGELEFQRRPSFKQPLQDIERRGAIPGFPEAVTRQVKQTLEGNSFGVSTDQVTADLFAPMRVPTAGYRKMIWTTARLDTGHWNADNPSEASTVEVANEFRQLYPETSIRVLLYDVPMTHYGHIERPKQMAAGIFAALNWLIQP